MSMQVPQGFQEQAYVATKAFALPGNPPLQVTKGTVLKFDGFSVSLEGMPPRQMPQFKGAISVGWVVLIEDFDPNAAEIAPMAAGMQLRPAIGGNPMEAKPRTPIHTAHEEERHVGNVAQHAAQVREGNRSNYRTQPGQRSDAYAIEPQDGIPVRQLGNPDGRRNPVDMSRDAGAAFRAAENVRVQPGQGRSRDEVLAAMTPDQRRAYEAEIAVRKSMHGILDQQVAVPPMVVQGPESQGQVVGRVASSETSRQSEGIQALQSVGGGIETVDLGGTGGQEEVHTVVREGIVFKETNGPKENRPRLDLSGDPRRVLAKSICADFPDIYNFDDAPRKKIARIQADFEDRPDIIKAVAAAEDVEMKGLLIKEFPEAFQS